jgi:hypothetical protein
MYHPTYYTVTNPHGEILCGSRTNHSACFADYAYGYKMKNGWTADNIVRIFLKKNLGEVKQNIYQKTTNQPKNYIFSTEQLQEFVDAMCEVGFLMELIEEKDEYIIQLKECDYYCKAQIRSAMDFVRILWEDKMPDIVKEYFLVPKNVRDSVNKFELIQMLAIKLCHSFAGHKTPCSPSGSPLHFTVFNREQLIGYFESLATDKTKEGQGSWQSWVAMVKKYHYPELEMPSGYYLTYCKGAIMKSEYVAILRGLSLNTAENINRAKNLINKKVLV